MHPEIAYTYYIQFNVAIVSFVYLQFSLTPQNFNEANGEASPPRVLQLPQLALFKGLNGFKRRLTANLIRLAGRIVRAQLPGFLITRNSLA